MIAILLPSLGLIIGLISLIAAVHLVQDQARMSMVELRVDRRHDRWSHTGRK